MATPQDPDQEMFSALEAAVKQITTILSDWKKKDAHMHGLAEQHADSQGAVEGAPRDMAIYAHRQALKRAMVEHAKAQQDQAPQDPSQDPSQMMMPQGSPSLPMG